MITTVDRHVWLVAHRGDPAHAPENTLASFRSAIRKGAKAVEMDVRRTADGVWVAFHDPTLKRTTGRSGRLNRLPWRDLTRVEAGGEPIPCVSDVLAICRSKGVEVFLDVKESHAERTLWRVLQGSKWSRRTRILAGNRASLVRWRKILPPHHPLYWVTGFRDSVPERRIRQAQQLRLTGIAATKGQVTSKTVKRIHRAGLEIYVWTMRTAADLKRYANLGVDGMMSEVW